MNTKRMAVVGVIALSLGLSLGANNSRAADFVWTNTTSLGFWQTPSSWTTNGGGMGGFPGASDNAFFTNAATYSVTLSNDVLNIQSNFFSNAAYTTAIVTLNLGAYELNPVYAGNTPGAFLVGDGATSTTVVYLASATIPGKGLIVPGRIVVGRNGNGGLLVTNGNVVVGNTILGNGPGGCGTLVLSGPNTTWVNTNTFTVGSHSNSLGCSVVISNWASMTVAHSFRLGSGSSSGGSSNNTLLLDSNARLFTTNPVTIGHWSSATAPSCSNTATVQGGAVWDNGNASFVIGSADGSVATGNMLSIMANSFVTNISYLTITPTNTLYMQGGWIGVSTATNSGTIQGCGTITGDVVVQPGGTVLADCGGALNFGGAVTNNGSFVAVSGTSVNFFGLVVNNGVINATNGSAQFYGGVMNNGTILTGPETNSWIDSNGKWEDAGNWSAGSAPSTTDLANVIANAGNNTVTIDSATTTNAGGIHMLISNLTLSAPLNSTNTLFLDNAGTLSNPLRVLNSVTVGSGGVISVTNASLEVDNVGTISPVDGVVVGWYGAGRQLNISGGIVSANYGYVGYNSSSSNNSVLVAGPGSVWSNAADLTIAGGFGNSLVITNGGAVFANNLVLGQNAGNSATLTLAGGTVTVAGLIATNAGQCHCLQRRRGQQRRRDCQQRPDVCGR